MLKNWLEENSAGIDLIAEAVRKQVFRAPYARENENAPIVEMYSGMGGKSCVWAGAAEARAKYRLGIGDIDGAIDDIVTIHRLARHVGKQGMLMSVRPGVLMEGTAFAIGIGSNPEFPPTKEQIERLLAELDALPPRQTLSEAIESERLFGLAGSQDMYWGNWGGDFGDPYWERSFWGKMLPHISWGLDINAYLARANEIYDALAIPGATIDGKTLDEFVEARKNPTVSPLSLWASVHKRSIFYADMMAIMLVPQVQRVHEELQRCEDVENEQRLTLLRK